MTRTASPATSPVDALLHSLVQVGTPFAPPVTTALTDGELLDRQRLLSEVERRVTAASAALAAEVRHRSRPELGHDGLAARLGARTPEKLVQTITGATKGRAATLVRMGSMLPTAPPAPERSPWMVDVAAALAAGDLSLDAADAIRAGLGTPTDEVPADALGLAARTLVLLAPTLTVEALAVRAREERLALDLALVVKRERALRDKRSLTLHRQADGMTRLTALLDPESAALVASVFDGITSPRRGGPRFVDEAAQTRASALVDDSRSTEQLALDAFVQLVQIGADVRPEFMVGRGGPTVQVLVTARDLSTRTGLGFIEGQTEPVSIATVERHICQSGLQPLMFDSDGTPFDLGREQRLYSRRQRRAMAARDGGCRFLDCERPPSWCEAHHADHWHRDHGETNVDVGILLCKHHHLLLHDQGWEIHRERGEFWLIPPPDVDPMQTPILMPSKSAAARRLAAQAS
jgi:hypothetical protein